MNCGILSLNDHIAGDGKVSLNSQVTHSYVALLQFNLVCGDAYKSELSTTLYFGGVLVGALLYGGLADKYGRKRCLAIAQVLSGVLSFAVVFFRYFYAYAVLRFFLGIQLQVKSLFVFLFMLWFYNILYKQHTAMITYTVPYTYTTSNTDFYLNSKFIFT